jgi:hypothetical protein
VCIRNTEVSSCPRVGRRGHIDHTDARNAQCHRVNSASARTGKGHGVVVARTPPRPPWSGPRNESG